MYYIYNVFVRNMYSITFAEFITMFMTFSHWSICCVNYVETIPSTLFLQHYLHYFLINAPVFEVASSGFPTRILYVFSVHAFSHEIQIS